MYTINCLHMTSFLTLVNTCKAQLFRGLPQILRWLRLYVRGRAAERAVEFENFDAGQQACLQARWHVGCLAVLPASWQARLKARCLASQMAGWPDVLLASFLAVLQASMQAGRQARRKACKSAQILIFVLLMIIVVANSKGGVGKSTIAVHLAGHLSEQGYSVTLADCDAQGSSSEWIAEAAPKVKAVRLTSPDDILNNLPVLGKESDFVVADGPGSDAETSRALLLRADFAIVPCKASMLEVRALAQATEVLRQAQDIRDGHPTAIIALSMVGKNYRLTRDMKEAAAALNLPLTRTSVLLRQIYADAPGQGKLVWGLGAR